MLCKPRHACAQKPELLKCWTLEIDYTLELRVLVLTKRPGFIQVLKNLESPGILLWHFPGPESPGKRPLVLESSGNLLNSAKKYEVYGRQ